MEVKEQQRLLWNEDVEKYETVRHRLVEMENSDIDIVNAGTAVSEKYGEYVIVEDLNGDEYYTFSKIVLALYKKLESMLVNAKMVRVRIGKNARNQLYFDKPRE